jgi:hypothetical protein
VLCVRGIEGYDHPGVVFVCDVVEELFDLGDLVRAVGHLDLGDGHRGGVDHRGEQGDHVVGVGPGPAQDLAVYRYDQQPVGLAADPLGQPRPDQSVQRGRVDGKHSRVALACGFAA